MEEGQPPLENEFQVDTVETLVGPCLAFIARMRRVDRHLAFCIGEALTEHIPGMSLAMTEALLVSPDREDRDRGAAGLAEVIEHDPERGFAIADRLMRDEPGIAMTTADYLQFAADRGDIDRDRLADLRRRHPDAWWPD